MTKLIARSKLVVILLGALAVAACSDRSPVTPSPSPGAPGDLSAKPPSAVPGVYQLTFHNSGLQEVETLTVKSEELVLMAYVADSAGRPAERGTATFEYCSYKGLPPNDITRADEAPKEACEAGTAAWARLGSVGVDAGRCPGLEAGYACLTFGVVQIPRTVGFRFRYAPQGSGIPSGTSAERNFTWVEGP